MIIENFSESHIDDLLEIENQCFSHAWSKTSFENELSKTFSASFSAVEGGKAIGCIICNTSVDEAYIFKVMVSKEYRRKGVALSLVERLIDYAADNGIIRLVLEVRESNEKARKLYEKAGFLYIGNIKKMYDDPQEDAAVYEKEL